VDLVRAAARSLRDSVGRAADESRGHERAQATPHVMTAVLGIDPAWTTGNPSGVALLEGAPDGWRSVAVAPSYAAFLAHARGEPINWQARHIGEPPDPAALLTAARALTSVPITVIAVDMPLSTGSIRGRRAADREISRAFGARHCATHCPSATRPGMLSDLLRDGFAAAGYTLATTQTALGRVPALLETYPHPALLTLCEAPMRLPYKAGKWRRYWRGASAGDAAVKLLVEYRRILAALAHAGVRDATLPLPEHADLHSPATLKPFEDAIDALVCAWVATRYMERAARAYGDATAAIWLPLER
jgi:predicted RNase H-like nuclease